MGKEGALGHDPLGWIKAVKENKKVSSDTGIASDKNSSEDNQPISSQTSLNQQLSVPANNVKPPDAVKIHQSSDTMRSTATSVPPPKPKVVIGRMYEKPAPEKPKSVQGAESPISEIRQPVKSLSPVTTQPQQVRQMETEISRPVTTSGDRFLTYIIIAYTTLMLILGYFAYSDLSKRMSRLEVKVFDIQKTLHGK